MTMGNFGRGLVLTVILAAGRLVYGQQSILGTNLIVNRNAEAGPAGSDLKTPVSSIPGWTVTVGKPTVLPYDLRSFVQLTDPTPPDHGFQYFAADFPSHPATLTQDIDVSPAASLISQGNVNFTATAYLGSTTALTAAQGASMAVAFKNASGQMFNTVTLEAIAFPYGGEGMFLQQQIGPVPAGTVNVTVTLTLQVGQLTYSSAADSLSFVLTEAVTTPALGTNLIVNGGAEAAPNAVLPAHALYVPGWSTANYAASVAPYGGARWISATAPGPADRGVSLFCGWHVGSVLSQDIDVSAASSLIDAGQVTYSVSAWLGGPNGLLAAAVLTYDFFGSSGAQFAPAAQLVPGSFNGFSLIETGHSDVVPRQTRWVQIILTFHSSDSLADNVAFTLSAPGAPPLIALGGIVSASGFGGFSSIAPGTFVEIYGLELASSTGGWTGAHFCQRRCANQAGWGHRVRQGEPAFINYISPGQVNVLVPSNAPIGTGKVKITLTNENGTSDPYGIYVNATEPGFLTPAAFILNGKQYVAATLPDGRFALPQGAVPHGASRPATPGETLTIYGIGFGPVTPDYPAGTQVTAQNALTTKLEVLLGSTPAAIEYGGLAPSYTGLYQFNIVVPNVAANDATPISIDLGGVKGSQTLYVAVEK